MSGEYGFSLGLAHESSLEWSDEERFQEDIDLEPSCYGVAPREGDINLELSAASTASDSSRSLQLQINAPEKTVEEQNGGIPALQAVPATSTQGKVVPRMLGIPNSQQEIYNIDKNEASVVVGHRQRTEYRNSQADNEIAENDESILRAFFARNSEPTFEEKQKQADAVGLTIGQVDNWYRNQRLIRPGSTSIPDIRVSNSGLGKTGGANKAWSQGNKQLDTGNSLQSTNPTLNTHASTTFSLPHRLGPDTGSEASGTTATSNSKPRFKCTFPKCKQAWPSLAAQVRHEHEVHWRVDFFPCLLCNILCSDGLFTCEFCGQQFQELKDIEKHILRPCDFDLHKVVVASSHRFFHAKNHFQDHHLERSERDVIINNKSHLKCRFCRKTFDRDQDPNRHSCAKKATWQRQKDLIPLFKDKAGYTIFSTDGLKGWTFRIDAGYPEKWPRECSVPTCPRSFDSLNERAKHFDEEHYVQWRTALKRGFSESGIDSADEDGTRSRSTREHRLRRRQPVRLPAAVREMDLAGVVAEKSLPATTPSLSISQREG